MEKQNNSLTCAEALGIMFIYLKLTESIDWSWWWVTAPLWIPLLVKIIAAVIVELKE